MRSRIEGRRAVHSLGPQVLNINPAFVREVEGLPESESRELIEELNGFATQERFVYMPSLGSDHLGQLAHDAHRDRPQEEACSPDAWARAEEVGTLLDLAPLGSFVRALAARLIEREEYLSVGYILRASRGVAPRDEAEHQGWRQGAARAAVGHAHGRSHDVSSGVEPSNGLTVDILDPGKSIGSGPALGAQGTALHLYRVERALIQGQPGATAFWSRVVGGR